MKDWRTLTAEDGIIARYLSQLDAARIEQWNRDLVRMLLQGGRKMKLKEEVKEAMAKAAEEQYPDAGEDIRRETLSSRAPIQSTARAVLEVIDQYEEVEVRVHKSGQWAYLPHDGRPPLYQTSPSYKTRTIYMRKPEPAPDVEELARRAVKAWRSSCGVPVCETMEALEKKLEE